MKKKDIQKHLDALTNYISGTYQTTEVYFLGRVDEQGKVSGSFFAPDSEKAALVESIAAPKLLEIGADLNQLAQWNRISKIEGSDE